jgi:hypothetical protein
VSDPRLLLDQVLSQFWDVVAALSNAAASSPSLGPLDPLPEYARAPFNGRVLNRIDAVALGDPVAQAAFSKHLKELGRNADAPWLTEHDALVIEPGDAISDSGIDGAARSTQSRVPESGLSQTRSMLLTCSVEPFLCTKILINRQPSPKALPARPPTGRRAHGMVMR